MSPVTSYSATGNTPVPSPGLPMTAAMHFGQIMVLYTAQDKVEAVVDGAPPGDNGRLFTVEPNEPTEVPWLAGEFILNHLAYTGVVRVNERPVLNTKGKKVGVEYDVDGAHTASLKLGKEQDAIIWQRYISDTMDDYVSRRDGKSKAVPEPPERIKRIMARRGYKLSDYGIKAQGFEDPGVVAHEQMVDENTALKRQIADLAKRLVAIEEADGSKNKK